MKMPIISAEQILRNTQDGIGQRLVLRDPAVPNSHSSANYILESNNRRFESISSDLTVRRGICHGGSRTHAEYNKRIWTLIRTPEDIREGQRMFYDWLFNRSPYRDAFPVKDADLVVAKGAIPVTSDIHTGIHLGALQLSRAITNEHRMGLELTFKVLQAGFKVHPMLMFWIACSLGLNAVDGEIRGYVEPKRIDYCLSYSGHCCFPSGARSFAQMLHFVKGIPNPKVNHDKVRTFRTRPSWEDSMAGLERSVDTFNLPTSSTQKRDPVMKDFLNSMMDGRTVTELKEKEEEEAHYENFWKGATDLVVKKRPAKNSDFMKISKLPFNIKPLVKLTEAEKLV